MCDGDQDARIAQLEKNAIRVSLTNLLTFPFVAAAVESGNLTLHGLWNQIGKGELWQLDPRSDSFCPI